MEFEWDVESTSAVTIHKQVQGMTLRDWFAGMALQGLLASKSVYHFDTASAEAYSAADAMMEARKK